MTTPEKIEFLKENEIFVFGSNLNGNHAGGAAKLAHEKFGAETGVGEGLTGQSYAFPTLNKEMQKVSLEDLQISRDLLYRCADENKDKIFLLTKVGCGIAGFTEEEMKDIFKGESPKNIIMPAGWKVIKGYKAFKEGLKCRDFQYEFGKDFYHEGDIDLCSSGFHFCKSLGDVYQYYPLYENPIVCEIESEGEVIDEDNQEKSVTNHIRIVRMLNAEEKLNNNGLNNLGHSNTGHWNTGHSNTGDRNTGHSNTGDSNTGHWNTGHSNTGDSNTGHSNTGDRNTGHWNTGHSNTGDRNTGHWNTGHSNTGHSNTGHSNTGDRNTGHRNTGHSNTGHWNTGHSNTGDRNTGHSNTGDSNTGDRNTGHSNTGDRNTGHSNTGHWNTTNFNTGSFNTKEVKEILVFNKLCSKEIWDKADKPYCLMFSVNQWIPFEEMTDKEKKEIGSSKYTGGYMKKLDYKEAFTNSMKNASKEDIEKIKNLPNFDSYIFFEISGFRI